MPDDLVFNGLNGATGGYLSTATPAQVSALAQEEFGALDETDPRHIKDLQRKRDSSEANFGVVDWVDPAKLAETGWGVIFAADADPGPREALAELLAHRKAQVSQGNPALYREYAGPQGYHPGETVEQFLKRRGAMGSGRVNPKDMPYYLLIVGDPETIPYVFQYQLDVQYAVGRIYFDTLDEYAQYARSVVTAENGNPRARRLSLFGACNPNDAATALSARSLIGPLAQELPSKRGVTDGPEPWEIQVVPPEQSTKAALSSIFHGGQAPALLFTASHGMGFPNGDPRQLPHQGALVCQDWPGPEAWRKPIPQDFYFAGDDLSADARLLGLVAFHFACYGAGTPRLDDYPQRTREAQSAMARLGLPLSQPIAPHAFVARLPQRLLGHPHGGALAVIGHVERALPNTFAWQWRGQTKSNVDDYVGALWGLMQGHPIGAALESFNQRYAELGSILVERIRDIQFGRIPDDDELAALWAANADARGFVIFGDPAVRLVKAPDGGGQPADTIAPVEIKAPATQGGTDRPEAAKPETGQPPAGAESAQAAGAKAAAEPPFGAPATSRVANAIVLPPGPVRLEIEPDTGRVIVTSEPTPGAASARAAGPDAEYALFGLASLEDLRQKLTGSLSSFVDQLQTAVTNLAAEASTLQVKTYTSDGDDVDYDQRNRKFTGPVHCRAITTVAVNGNTESVVPQGEGPGGPDDRLWAMHLAMVERAQANRAEMIEAILAAASTLLDTLKPG